MWSVCGESNSQFVYKPSRKFALAARCTTDDCCGNRARCSPSVCVGGYTPKRRPKTYWAADKSSLAECCDHIGKCSGFSCSAVTILKETQPDTCAGTQCTNAEWGEPSVKCRMSASSDTEVLNVDVATQVCASRTCTTKQR